MVLDFFTIVFYIFLFFFFLFFNILCCSYSYPFLQSLLCILVSKFSQIFIYLFRYATSFFCYTQCVLYTEIIQENNDRVCFGVVEAEIVHQASYHKTFFYKCLHSLFFFLSSSFPYLFRYHFHCPSFNRLFFFLKFFFI